MARLVLRIRSSASPPAALVLTMLLALVVVVAIGCGNAAPGDATGVRTPRASASPKAKASKKPSPKSSTTSHPGNGGSQTGSTGAASVAARIVFVDVGQGDAIIIQSGRFAGLVDGGPPGADDEVAAQLARLHIRHLSELVMTHPDADHIGDLAPLIDTYRPATTLYSQGSSTQTWALTRSTLARDRSHLVLGRTGEHFVFGKVSATVLNPSRAGGDTNADSVVLLLTVAGKRILLTGDLTGPNEAAVGAQLARGPPVYALKVAHHGSAYATSTSFLDEARPRFAVISVGPNTYGHPSPQTIARLRGEGATIYSTQKNGSVTLTIYASGRARWTFSQTAKPVTSAALGSSGGGTGGGSTAPGSTIVYITRTGECYHRDGCRYLSASKIRITLKEAKERGYRPCSVCDPPR